VGNGRQALFVVRVTKLPPHVPATGMAFQESRSFFLYYFDSSVNPSGDELLARVGSCSRSMQAENGGSTVASLDPGGRVRRANGQCWGEKGKKNKRKKKEGKENNKRGKESGPLDNLVAGR